MDVISMLNLLPWSQDDRVNYEREQGIKHKTAGTRTYAEEKKFLKSARLPPTMYERIKMMPTTYGQFLEMLFTTNNSHQNGVLTAAYTGRKISSRRFGR